MAQTSPHLLQLLLDKECEERDRRETKVRQLQERLALAQSQCEQLQSYRQHYQQHWQTQFKNGATRSVLQCYQQFIDRLDSALAQQAHTVTHVSALLEQAQQDRLQQEIRVASIEKLLERKAEAVLAAEQRAQQRQDDEWAQRAYRGSSLAGARAVAEGF